MTTLPVHWHEGLFLRPHHFQVLDRRVQEILRLSEEWNQGYAYGIHQITVDEARLATIEREVSRHWPESVDPADLGNETLAQQCLAARASLLSALGLASII